MDPNTATASLKLSEGNKKARLTANTPQDGSVPHVLCTEGLTGRHYFEVTWTPGGSTYAGVVLACTGGKPGKQKTFEHYHKYYGLRCLCGMYWADQSQTMSYDVHPPEGCNRFGVYLDYPVGTVSFFAVWGKTLHHLHTFKYNFTEPVYPGLYIVLKDNYAAFCPAE